MEAKAYMIDRLDQLISNGEIVLKGYNQIGNIDQHDIWFTESKNFLSVNLPDLLDKFSSIASKYNDQLLMNDNGRATYNLIQEQLEVLKLAQGTLYELPENGRANSVDDNSVGFFDAFGMKPGIFGFTLDLKVLFKHIVRFFRKPNQTNRPSK